jgi:hypothetical protein
VVSVTTATPGMEAAYPRVVRRRSDSGNAPHVSFAREAAVGRVNAAHGARRRRRRAA